MNLNEHGCNCLVLFYKKKQNYKIDSPRKRQKRKLLKSLFGSFSSDDKSKECADRFRRQIPFISSRKVHEKEEKRSY